MHDLINHPVVLGPGPAICETCDGHYVCCKLGVNSYDAPACRFSFIMDGGTVVCLDDPRLPSSKPSTIQ